MQCVILAAGEGKRMRPLTASRPKVMLPVANRPMLESLVRTVHRAGITEFVFVVGYHEEKIRSYFGDGEFLGVHIRYSTQRRQRGTADALDAARGLVHGKFLLINGDMLLNNGDIKSFCAEEVPCISTYASDHPEDFGVVTEEGGIATGLVEKSPHPPGNQVNAGAYILDEGIFDILPNLRPSERGELELTDALEGYISEGRLRVHPLSEWHDIGAPWNLLDANETLMAELETDLRGTVEEGVSLKGPVVLGEGSVIRAGTCIEGPCIIGKNCKIGPHAYIRGSTAIGDDCHIGHCTELKNSIIMNNTKIPHFNYLGDSVVGSGCNFGAGTKVANLRHDGANIRAGGHDTGRRKFGAVIGDNVHFGINSSVNVGTIVGSNVQVSPGAFIGGEIADSTFIGR